MIIVWGNHIKIGRNCQNRDCLSSNARICHEWKNRNMIRPWKWLIYLEFFNYLLSNFTLINPSFDDQGMLCLDEHSSLDQNADRKYLSAHFTELISFLLVPPIKAVRKTLVEKVHLTCGAHWIYPKCCYFKTGCPWGLNKIHWELCYRRWMAH